MRKETLKERLEKGGFKVVEGQADDMLAFQKGENGFCFLKFDVKYIEKGEIDVMIEKKNFKLDLSEIFQEFIIEPITKDGRRVGLYEKGVNVIKSRANIKSFEIEEVDDLSDFSKILLQMFGLI